MSNRKGHILLEGKPYVLVNHKSIVRTNANQASGKIAQGAADYDDLTQWSVWLQSDWRAGVGKKDPTEGALYSTLDTRFEGQLSMPGFLRHVTFEMFVGPPASEAYHLSVDDVQDTPERIDITIGEGQDITALGWMLEILDPYVIATIEVLLPGVDPGCDEVTIKVWSVTGGEPDTVLDTITVPLCGRIGWFWHAIFPELTPIGGSPSVVPYFLSIQPGDGTQPLRGTVTLPAVTMVNNSDHWQFDGQWSGNSNYGWMVRYHSNWSEAFGLSYPLPITAFANFNGSPHFIIGNQLFVEDPSISLYSITDTSALPFVDLLSTGDRLYLARGSTQKYWHMDILENVTGGTAAEPAADKLFLWRGFLWRVKGGRLFYTSDETSWVEILPEIADRGFSIRGINGHMDDVIVSTDNALYRVGWGDLVQQITLWGAPSPTNGKYMLNFQGDLYISHGESLLRYDGQSLLPVGPDLGEGLAPYFAGPIVALASNNNWLLCGVAGEVSSVWIYNGQGWHFATELPYGVTLSALSYVEDDDNGFSEFLIGTQENTIYNLRISDTRTAMRRVTDAHGLTKQYHHWSGWLETDWFYGNLREVHKDFESIYLDGEDLDVEGLPHVDLYWQDERSIGWERLGAADVSGDELRFTDETRRPAARRLKVGVLLYNNFHLHTPVVTAVRTKFRPMIVDIWRWQLPIMVSENQQMIDGTINPYSEGQMISHLDNLTKRVTPFRFTDTDNQQFDVMVLNGSRQIDKWDRRPGAEADQIHYIYNLTIEQVTADAGLIGIVSLTELPNLWGWWDFSDMATLYTSSNATTRVATDGDPIGYIADKSSNGRHLTQSTGDLRPLWVADVQNGFGGSLWGSGATVKRLISDATHTISANDMTLFVVAKLNDTGAASGERGVITAATNSPSGGSAIRTTHNNPDPAFVNVASVGTSTPLQSDISFVGGAPLVAVATFTAARRRLLVNLQQRLDHGPVSAATRRVALGSEFYDTTGFFWNGYIVEAAAFSPALTDGQMNQLRAYANRRWKIF